MKALPTAPARGVTIRDVARLSGVSAMTVSRALRQPETVSGDTLRKVQSAVKRTGYVSNRVASRLSSNRGHVVGVVIPIINAAFADTIRGMKDVLRQEGYEMLLGISDYSPQVEHAEVAEFLAQRVDAIALTGHTHLPQTRAMLRRAGIPVVQIWTVTRRPIDLCVGLSHHAASRDMVHHLHARGYRRIAYLGGHTAHNDRTSERERGYVDAMRELQLPVSPQGIVRRGFHLKEGASGLREVRERMPDVEAVFCGSDMLAAGALFECQRQRLRVPQDLAIAGFDDAELSSEVCPALTTVHIPRFDIGVHAAQAMLARLSGQPQPARVQDLGYRIVVRETT